MAHISRRDFLKLSSLTLKGLAFSPFLPNSGMFDDAQQVRVATNSVSVFSAANDQSLIVSQRFRDELVNIYEEVNSGTPTYNPIWYRVWSGYLHRARPYVDIDATGYGKTESRFDGGIHAASGRRNAVSPCGFQRERVPGCYLCAAWVGR